MNFQTGREKRKYVRLSRSKNAARGRPLIQIVRGTVRIPNKVILPFGYHIMIRQVTDSEMDRQDANADGIWDNEAKTIFIRKRLPVTRRRYILAHELGHAWLDWQHRYLDDGKARS